MGRAFKGLFRLLRRNQNLLFVVVAFGTTLGLAVVSGYWLFYRAAYVIGGRPPGLLPSAAAPPPRPAGAGGHPPHPPAARPAPAPPRAPPSRCWSSRPRSNCRISGRRPPSFPARARSAAAPT